jgi:hypothetical protein
MSAATDSNIRTIYIPLLDEGTSVMRPTQGELLGGGLYRVLATPTYDPDDEHWEFPPGTVVHCVTETRDGKDILVAHGLGGPTGACT